MIGNRLGEMSKGYLKLYHKNSSQHKLESISAQLILMFKHLQYSNTAAFSNDIFNTSIIFTTGKLF